MTQSITAQLIAAIPEAEWPEAVRRLRLLPSMGAQAKNADVLARITARGAQSRLSRQSKTKAGSATAAEKDLWMPGRLALEAYAVAHPECEGQAEPWLLGGGRGQLSRAYTRLIGSNEPLHPLDDALPAALGLRLRLVATSDWQALAQDAAAQPERWLLPIQYLWGLLEHSQEKLFVALMQQGRSGADLAARASIVNLAPDELVEMIARLGLETPIPVWIAFASALESLGHANVGRRILRPRAAAAARSGDGKGLPPMWNPLDLNVAFELERALLAAATDDYALARPMISEAWSQIRHLRADIAGHMGRLALHAGDAVTAHAGYQDALHERPDDPVFRAGLAAALVALGRPEEALALLDSGASRTPAEQIATAEASLAMSQAEKAIEALNQLEAVSPASAHALTHGAQLYAEAGQAAASAKLMARAAAAAGHDAVLYVRAAKSNLAAGLLEAAREMAVEAVALAPRSADARECLGRALMECGQPADALAHFSVALQIEPSRHSAAIGQAQAALESDNVPQAIETASKLLAVLQPSDIRPPEQDAVAGEAHTLLGEALSRSEESDEAFEHFQQASVLAPALPDPWRAMARHHRRSGDLHQALAVLETGRQALTVAASQAASPLLADLAEAYLDSGRPTEAILALREACSADPSAHQPHHRLGQLLRQQGSADEAVGVLRHALELRPGHSATLHDLGLALERMGHQEEAWSAFQKSVLERPTSAAPYLDLGRMTLTLRKLGQANASPLQAVAALRSAVERAPGLAQAHGLLAEAQHLAGDAQSALDSYQQALRLDPTQTGWALGLGLLCLELKQPVMAIAALQDALELAPDSGAVHEAMARAYAANGLWPDVRRITQARLQLEPENTALLQLAAEAEDQLGEREKALAGWRRAVSLAPDDSRLLVALARCLLSHGREDEARATFAKALSASNLASKDSADVRLEAGAAFLAMGEVDAAYEVLAEAAQAAPHSARVQMAFGRVAARVHNFEASYAAFMQAAEHESGAAKAGCLRDAGEALWALNRQPAAIALWQRALEEIADDSALHSRLGLALLESGQAAEALEHLKRALEDNPLDGALAREAGRAALHVGTLDRSAEFLIKAVELSPSDADARYLLGQVRAQQGQADAALNLYRQATRVNPGDGRFLAAIANALAGMGQVLEAVDVIGHALQASPDNAEVQQRAGDIYMQAGRASDAVAAYQACVTIHPDDPQAHLMLGQAQVLLAEAQQHASRAGRRAKTPGAATTTHANATASLQAAAALGADPIVVRYWTARARAASGDTREARRLLDATQNAKELPDVGGSMANLYRAMGAAERMAGQIQQSRKTLQAALQHDGNLAMAHIELGLTEQDGGDSDAAEIAFRRAVAADPDNALAHFHLADALLTLGRREDAAAVLQRAVALDATVAAWHHLLAQLYADTTRSVRARDSGAGVAHLQRAVELEPENGQYLADLARALAQDGDLPAAAHYYQKAADAAQDDSAIWAECGQVYLELHQHEDAAECFTRALALEPGMHAARLGAARVNLVRGNLDEAAHLAESAVAARPNDAQALVCLADVEAARGQTADAERHYLAAAEKAPNPSAALLSLGRMLSHSQKWEKALAILERASAASPDSEAAHAALGEAQFAAGQYAAAVQSHREAARIAPREPRHLLQLGRACRALGQLDQALSHLIQARELAPHDDEIAREMGMVFDQRHQYERALDMYKLAIELAPRSAANYVRAGIALRRLNNYPNALAALERAVALDPSSVEATRQLAVISAAQLLQTASQAARAVVRA